MPVKRSLLCQAGRRRQCLRTVLCYLRSCGDDGRGRRRARAPAGAREARRAGRSSRQPSSRRSSEAGRADQARGGAAMLVERPPEPSKVALGVETEARHDDEAPVDRGERYVARRADGLETFAEADGGVLGAVQEDGAGRDDRKAPDRVGAARDTDGEFEGEPRIQSDNPELPLNMIVES